MSDLRKMARDAGFNTEFDDYVIDHWKRFERLAELIKDAALAQPEQGAVTWRYDYTRLPQRKPLTDEEIIEAIKHISHNEMSAFAIARAIERIIK